MTQATRIDFGPGDALLHVSAAGRADVAIYDVEQPSRGALIGHGLMLLLSDEAWVEKLVERTRAKLAGGEEGSG